MRKAIPIMPRPNLVRVSMTSEVGIGGAVVSLPVDPPGAAVVVYWFMLSRAASSVKACSSCKNFPEEKYVNLQCVTKEDCEYWYERAATKGNGESQYDEKSVQRRGKFELTKYQKSIKRYR